MLVWFRKIMSWKHFPFSKNSNFSATSTQAFLTTSLRHIDTNDCFCHTSRETFHFHQKQPPEVFNNKRFTKFHQTYRKNLCQSNFFNNVAGLRHASLLKKKLWRKCFLVNFPKFLTTPFLQTTASVSLRWFYHLKL